MDGLLSLTVIPALLSFISVTLAVTVIIDFTIYFANRYRERYLQEASVNLDDVFIQLPAARVFELSWGLSILGVITTILTALCALDEFAWEWLIVLAVIIGIILFPLPLIVLRILKTRRLNKFNIQLEDGLITMSSSLKAGFSILQAIDEVAAQNINPLSVEFRLLIHEIQLGVQLEQALDNMNNRLHSDDFELVATAIITARQTGGELTSTLERVAHLVSERIRIANKVHAVTAMGRLQAIIIGIMPFALLLGMYMINGSMVESFIKSPLGVIALVMVVTLITFGFIAIRKITNIEV